MRPPSRADNAPAAGDRPSRLTVAAGAAGHVEDALFGGALQPLPRGSRPTRTDRIESLKEGPRRCAGGPWP
ncbi:MAG: hypothetical protein WCP98_09060 [Actinomycetes bacterium]